MGRPIGEVKSIKAFLEARETACNYVEYQMAEQWTMNADRTYIVPAYQREIKWQPNNAKTLISDLVASEKFLGYVLLSASNHSNYEIIDGQQRITVLLMIIHKLKQILGEDIGIGQMCPFQNESFPDFKDALDNNFDFGDQEANFIQRDLLNQRDAMKDLFDCVKNAINALSDEDVNNLAEHIRNSYVNLLISRVTDDDGTRKLCVDYFIDINNKSIRLDCIEILKAYSFRETFEEASRNWITIVANIKDIGEHVYSQKKLFQHYFLCCANESLNYALKGVTEEYLINSDIIVAGHRYLKGTNIEEVINTRRFYSNMLGSIIEFQEFIKLVFRDRVTPSAEFENQLTTGVTLQPGDRIDPDVVFNTFTIIASILKSSDIVPKLLVMKYFLYVYRKEEKTKEDIKLIYWINVIATCFSASNTNTKSQKVTAAFSNIVLSEQWKEKVVTTAYKKLNKFPSCIGFDREVKQDGKYTETSGEILARRVQCISSSYFKRGRQWKYNEAQFKKASNTQGDYNIEHFIINQRYKYVYKYHGTDVSCLLPENMKPWVSYLSNYLLIKATINTELGSNPINEKIAIIKRHLNANEDVFGNSISKDLFAKIESAFRDTRCPSLADLNEIDSLEHSKARLEEYYREYFKDEFINYLSSITWE